MKSWKSLSDEEFFELYCARADVVFNNGENQMVFIKDKNHHMVYISLGYKQNFNISDVNDNYPENTSSEAYKNQEDQVLAQDMNIASTRTAQNFLFIDDYHHVSYIHKRPIVNPSTGNYVGLAGYVSHFALPDIVRLIYRINGIDPDAINQVSVSESLGYDLTIRQKMVLFLYVNRYSNSEISNIMTAIDQKLSKSRVNDYLENLKYIFNARSKEELIEKALGMGYNLVIPRNFLKPGSYPIDDEVILIR